MTLKTIIKASLTLLLSSHFAAHASPLIADSDGINESNILSLASHPTDPNIHFAGTSAGLYKSEDGMKSWKLLANNPLKTYEVADVVINPSDPAMMYTEIYSFDLSKYDQIDYFDYYVSSDSGHHWAKMHPISDEQRIYKMTFCTTHRNELIATTNSGIYSSTDLGSSWHQFGTDNPKARNYDFLISNLQNHPFYKITDDGIFKSNDHGVNWSLINTTQKVMYFGAYLDGQSNDGSEFYVFTFNKVYRFNVKQESLEVVYDRGRANTLPHNIFASTENNTLFIIANDQLMMSTDHGKNWHEITNKPFSSPISLWRNKSNGLTIFTDHGLYQTDNKASTWRSVNSGFKNIFVNQMAYDNDTHALYAGTSLNLWVKKNGDRWQDTAFLKGKSIKNVYLTKDHGGKKSLLVSAGDALEEYFIYQLYLSKDDGKTWQRVFDDGDYLSKIRVNPANPTQVFAVRNGSIIQSKDGGETWGEWQIIQDGGWGIVDLGFNPYNPLEIEIVTITDSNHSIYKSIDGGTTWNLLPRINEFNWYYGYYFDKPSLGRTFLTSYKYPYLYQTVDGGVNYTVTGASALPDMYLQEFIIDPSHSTTFYAALKGGNYRASGGVYISKNSGANWSALTEEDVTRMLTTALVTPDKMLYVGTEMGIYRMSLND